MIGGAALAASASARLATLAPGGIKALAVLGAVALVFLGGYFHGRDVTQDKAQAQAKRHADAALAQFRADVAEGQQRTAAFFERLQELVINGNTLTERLAHGAPLTVLRPGACPDGAAAHRSARVVSFPAAAALSGSAAVDSPGGHRSPGDPAAAGAAAQPVADVQSDAAAPAGSSGGVGLTLGAVSVWNSALAGAGVPAGACGADGRPEPACAADAGLDVTDAWRNHIANAQLCNADRERLRALTDHLKAREARTTGTTSHRSTP